MGKDRGGVSDWPLPLLLHNCRGRGVGRCGSSMFSVYLVQLFPTPPGTSGTYWPPRDCWCPRRPRRRRSARTGWGPGTIRTCCKDSVIPKMV